MAGRPAGPGGGAEPEQAAAALCALGVALIRAGEVSAEVERAVAEVADRMGLRGRAFTTPTGLFVRVDPGERTADGGPAGAGGPGGAGGTMDFAAASPATFRLDQVHALYLLLDQVRAQPAQPAEVMQPAGILAELERIDAMPRRFRPGTVIAGHALMTIGLGMLLRDSTWAAVAAYAATGLGVGLLLAVAARWAVVATALPVLAAIIVSAVAVRWAGPLTGETPADLLIPPLVTLLPGAALTTGAIELASGATLSGVTRSAAGLNQLLLLALGILAGVTLASPAAAVRPVGPGLGAWAPWAGVAVLGAGFMLYHAVSPGVLPWIIAALYAERFCQLAGTAAAGSAFGGFTAGLILPALAALASRRSAIPSAVIYLPSFWMLVPGAIGLTAVSTVFTTRSAGNVTELVAAIVAVLAVTLGILTSSRLLPARWTATRGPG